MRSSLAIVKGGKECCSINMQKDPQEKQMAFKVYPPGFILLGETWKTIKVASRGYKGFLYTIKFYLLVY